MGEPLTVHLDDDVYDSTLEIHKRTGQSESSIVNNAAKRGFEQTKPTLSDSLFPTFGQALFIVGWVVAFYTTIITGAGISIFGLAIMLGAKVDEHLANGAESYTVAFKRSLGI